MSDDRSTEDKLKVSGGKTIRLSSAMVKWKELNLCFSDRVDGKTVNYWLEPKVDMTPYEGICIQSIMVCGTNSFSNYDWGHIIKEYGVERHFRIEKES